MEMETSELRRKIAEIEGIPVYDYTSDEIEEEIARNGVPVLMQGSCGGESGWHICDDPNNVYSSKQFYTPDLDLNHIQRVCEKVLVSEEQQNAFVDKLFSASYSGPKVNSLGEFVWVMGWINATATAEQRCRALIRVMEAENVTN